MAQKFKEFEQLSQNKEPVTMTTAKKTNNKITKEDAKPQNPKTGSQHQFLKLMQLRCSKAINRSVQN